MKTGVWKLIIPAVLMIIFPFIGKEGYLTHLAITIGIFSVLASSLNLLMGYAGLVSIAHGAFFGIGAYTSGILVLRYGIPFWVALPLSAFFTALIAFGISIPSFRTKGIYYIIVTIAFQFIASEVFEGWYKMTGGGLGLRGIPRPGPISLPLIGALSFQSKFGYYYLVLVFVLVVHFILWRIIKSPLGTSLMAIRDNETKAMMMGLNPLIYKIFVFVFISGLAGFAGSLYAHYLEFAHPDLFNFFISVDLYLMVVLGGAGTFFGPLFGVFILEMIREFLHGFVAFRLFLFGLMLVLIIIFIPQGLLKALSDIGKRLILRGGCILNKLE
jgi:branched-chain amino acid transport system permease protein